MTSERRKGGSSCPRRSSQAPELQQRFGLKLRIHRNFQRPTYLLRMAFAVISYGSFRRDFRLRARDESIEIHLTEARCPTRLPTLDVMASAGPYDSRDASRRPTELTASSIPSRAK